MVKSLVSKLQASSNLSLAQTFGKNSEETNYAKHRNDPGRFFGDGVQFKAKLIGILEVGEARGDRMCQEALQDLKMAIRAAGEHKQRIIIHVTIDGLRLRDEKTSDSLYHHPVHKISFIAQDMTDSRAFGYIFGSPDSGHRFFGIKTDKAASQVVLAMRDLFQVVFELKKKEIEMARQQIQGKSMMHDHASQLATLSSLKSGHTELASSSTSAGHQSGLSMLGGASSNGVGLTRLGVNLDVAKTSGAAAKEISPESVADLVDLEQELTSLQRGISQMERITPNDPSAAQSGIGLAKSASEDDPFGDSFIYVPSYNILPPPPESGRTRNKSQANKTTENTLDTLISPAPGASGSPATLQADDDDSWLHELQQQNDVFDTTKVTTTPTPMTAAAVLANLPMAPLAARESSATPTPQSQISDQAAAQQQQQQQQQQQTAAANTTTAATIGSSSSNIDVGLSALGNLPTEREREREREGEGGGAATSVMSELTTNPLEDDPANPVLLPRDTDPFSPTRKKSDPDPFQEGDLFAKLDAFEFDTPQPSGGGTSSTTTTTTGTTVFNGPLQVQLPPEQQQQQQQEGWQADISRLEPAPPPPHSSSSSVRHRPTPVASVVNVGGPLDVISSISNKKMPHLFGQARFSKRGDSSNSVGSSVNMRRLQESDSLSENETAPEPPPRPDSTPYAEPPPLPPKKQFSDLVIRPTPAAPPVGRYEYLNHSSNQLRRSVDAPPIPLPSRRVGRSDGNFPGPGRPRKPGHTEDDYLAPLGGTPPPLLPPPTQSSSSRARPQRQASLGRPQDIYENKAEILQAAKEAASLAPDITLAQLLTLGIDELALKLNVPVSKLSTMTIVQLTSYLSEYLQSSGDQTQPKSRASPAVPLQSPANAVSSSSSAVFKVNFDQQTSFVAKFDDTFGEDVGQDSFVANFANFNEAPTLAAPVVPSADRYAVFREIIDQELQQQQQETDLMGDLTPPPVDEVQQDAMQQQQPLQQQQQSQLDMDVPEMELEQPPPKIDTKITEVVAQAKDRYAALRDIILVENLFVKPPATVAPAVAEKDLLQDLFSDEFNEDQDIRQIMDGGHDRRGLVDSRGLPAEPSSSALTVADDDDDDDEDAGGESSMDSNEKDAEPVSAQDQYEKLSTSADKPEFKTEEQLPPKQDNKFLTVVSGPSCVVAAGRDDIEIDELMQRAISNLSLDSRDRISPATSSAAPSRGPSHSLHTPSQFNDVSTSPIPLQKSPALTLNPTGPSPVPSQLSAVSQLIDTATKQIRSEREREKPPSWATFDSPKVATTSSGGKGKARLTLPPPPASNTSQQDTAESPCSSDPRDDAGGWSKQQQQRRWAKKERQHTSSSSRDLSPWDDDTPEYLKQQRSRGMPPSQLPPHPPAHGGYYMRHARRLNSCDEDYDYEAEYGARRDREQPRGKFKHGLSRSRDNFELDSPSWYHHPAHHTWSPQEIEQGVRARSFERSAYERSSYGPPAPMYDKRGQPLPRDRERERERERDRSKYREREYRDYARPGYDFDYENVYEERRSPMGLSYKSRPEYLYERDRDRERDRERERKSFDRESVESFESSSRRRRSFGSGGDVYGSLDSRDDYRERDRELKTRSLRKPASSAGKLRVTGDIDYEQDSEQDFQRQRSLQRPSQLGGDVVPGAPQRLRKSSGSSPWDGEEPALPGQKSWKRPASAAETERRLAESRRAAALAQTPSDGEKDRRFRKKTRARSTKDLATVGVRYGSGRGVRDNYDYISHQRNDDDDDEDYVDDEPPTDEDKFERLNRRRHEMHQRMMETERRQLERHAPTLSKLPGQNRTRGGGGVNSDYGFVDSYEQTPTPRSNASSTAVMMSGGESSAGVGGGGKFNFDDGFESDFNQSSPPPAPAGTASSCNSTPAGLISASSTVGSKSLFRFSNDFSEREKLQQQQQQLQQQQQQRDNFEMETPPMTSTPPITQKLRFDDNVKVSQFDDAAFEDDFAKASFDFDKEQSSPAAPSASSRKQNMRSSKLQQRQELIKKSESVNIFAKKQEDPFEDDEFFKSPDELPLSGKDEGGHEGDGDANKFQWNEDNNFAKFDENM